ncbi:YtxH domain-containing protein [Robertmurraya sp. FSL W8-0741]|uniref:YtxH domain-containing protein n=1 Tax=Robertmurraya TaxID=2837507 RepID=UPI0010F9A94F|nr:YtxH domain-containing protein [Robertmurraya siralis]
MNKKSFMLGLLIGGISAGVAALLSAPASGKESRIFIKENTHIWKQQLFELAHDLEKIKTSISALTKEGKDTLSSFIKDVKILLETWQIEMKPHEEQLKNELHSIQKTIQELESSLK